MAEANESAERKERCATCRWWDRQPPRWSMTVEQEADWNLRAFGGIEGSATMAERIRKEREEIETIGYGNCHALPDAIQGKKGSHFCGQWRARE